MGNRKRLGLEELKRLDLDIDEEERVWQEQRRTGWIGEYVGGGSSVGSALAAQPHTRGVAITGILATVGFLSLLAQLLFGGALNEAAGDSSSIVMAPLQFGLICLVAASVWGLATGPAAVRVAVFLGFGGLAAFGYVVQAIYANTSLYLAVSGALFVLAITFWIGAYVDERAIRDASKVQG